MRILNYIGEFFLFRWLIGKFKKSTNELYAHTECLETSFDRNTKSLNDNHNEDVAPINDAIPPISDNSIDDFNNSEELDDLDILMRHNIETLTVIIIAGVIVAPIMIGAPEVILNRMMIFMTSRTTTT